MTPAAAWPASGTTSAHVPKRLITARCAFAAPAVSRLPVTSSSWFEADTSVRQHGHSRYPSFRRLIASVNFPRKAGRSPPGAHRKAHQRSKMGTSGLPLFSRSSSNLSDRKIVAHPVGWLCILANDSAEFSSRKIPPIRPVASRATQKPCPLRPMKNCGNGVADNAGIERLKWRRVCGGTAGC